MDFGRVADVDKVDFSMPKDHAITKQLFKELKKNKKVKPQIYIGCAKWGRKDWIGKLYPPKTKEADFLKLYTEHFNSIELNALFYRLFPKSTVEKWASFANDDFRFCPKFTNIITHIKRLNNVEKETDLLLDTYSAFGKKLGTSFIQLDDRFAPKFADRIQGYLKSLPRDFDVAIEFRHPEFSIDSPEVMETYSAMKELGVSSIITDTAGRRDVMHMKLTTPTAFIRFVGNSLHDSDYKRIDDWIDRIDTWLDSGLQTLYFFIHQHDELYSPELSKYMIDKMNKQCGLKVKAPKLLNDNDGKLF
ncbi:MAG TPA: DUF72 domain-containing protein [Chitinophagales bacterium]|nr:DUF72 domain-containing protein [Chitinophagales bacterium]